ncbi:Transmembrane protein 56 [Hondaea fermentalgiana]|uniref:Transmembrane protein 56 n=1 Tax=Hondaea fermentalgiana TaxID=2315210 RepID=A0A2R5G8P3_9STRA|nr:Transmembrane protein 56 [Hondaea fermentalgiana]|eukprot:GBG24421.1 Transmembrane protein 56 [Hondaea fermentalgiana]
MQAIVDDRDIAEIVGNIARGSAPWLFAFHGLYWACRSGIAPMFETYRNIERDKRGFWCASMVSSGHAILITALSVRALMKDPGLVTRGDFFYTTPESTKAAEIFFGYIASDLLLSVYYRARWNGWVENLLHHVCILATWGIFLATDSGGFFTSVAHICEITTPFVNQRWFLYEAGLKTTTGYFYNGLAMLGLWFLSRIVLYTAAGVALVNSRDQLFQLGTPKATLVLFCYTAGFTLQYQWFYRIVKGALKSLRSRRNDTDKTTKQD